MLKHPHPQQPPTTACTTTRKSNNDTAVTATVQGKPTATGISFSLFNCLAMEIAVDFFWSDSSRLDWSDRAKITTNAPVAHIFGSLSLFQQPSFKSLDRAQDVDGRGD